MRRARASARCGAIPTSSGARRRGTSPSSPRSRRASSRLRPTLVKPGGRLVYATCSVLPEENDAIVDAFLGAHDAFTERDTASLLAQASVPLDTGARLRLLPHLHGCDGFFAAVLERKALVDCGSGVEPKSRSILRPSMITPIDFSRLQDRARLDARLARARWSRCCASASRGRSIAGSTSVRDRSAAARAPVGQLRAHRVSAARAGADLHRRPSHGAATSGSRSSSPSRRRSCWRSRSSACSSTGCAACSRRRRGCRASEVAIGTTIWGLALLYFLGVLPEIAAALDAIVLPLGKTRISVLTILEGFGVVVAHAGADAVDLRPDRAAARTRHASRREPPRGPGAIHPRDADRRRRADRAAADRLRPDAADGLRRRARRRHRARPAEARGELHRRLHDPARPLDPPRRPESPSTTRPAWCRK